MDVWAAERVILLLLSSSASHHCFLRCSQQPGRPRISVRGAKGEQASRPDCKRQRFAAVDSSWLACHNPYHPYLHPDLPWQISGYPGGEDAVQSGANGTSAQGVG